MVSPSSFRSVSAVCAALNSLPGVYVRDSDGVPQWFSFGRREWRAVPCASVADRIWLQSESRGCVDVGLDGFLVAKGRELVPLWRSIDIPPFVKECADAAVAVGAKMKLAEDANYYGGDHFPAGCIVVVEGYCSRLSGCTSVRSFVFVPVARFPDGTFRQLPSTAVPAGL